MLTKFQNKNLYEVLGLTQDASKEQIESAYQDLCRIYHPKSTFYAGIVKDEPTEEHRRIFEIIRSAYATLVHDDSRVAYDNSLFRDEHKTLFSAEPFPDAELGHSTVKPGFRRSNPSTPHPNQPLLVRPNQASPRQLSKREVKARQEREANDEAWAANFPSMSEIMQREKSSLWRTMSITLLGAFAGAVGGVMVFKFVQQLINN